MNAIIDFCWILLVKSQFSYGFPMVFFIFTQTFGDFPSIPSMVKPILRHTENTTPGPDSGHPSWPQREAARFFWNQT